MASWCLVCGTRHESGDRCRGEVPLTGAEFPGWKVNVETPCGLQALGVLLAEAGQYWRARVMTMPNVLWSLPGGRGTMKFIGASKAQAEMKAVSYIREHCATRGFTMRDQLQAIDGFSHFGGVHSLDREQRFKRILPVRYGVNRPTLFGRTVNLSESGLFVHTEVPIVEGSSAGLMLELEHMRLPLRGSVMWARSNPGPSAPSGMGMRLLEPPESYLRYVHALALT